MCNQSKCECSMTEHAKALAKLKVGDKVVISGVENDYKKGWKNSWAADMTKFVGQTATITELTGEKGVKLSCTKDYCFPAHVLELVIPEQPKPHLHAASMKLYAEDAAETDKPWERWECRHKMTNTSVGWCPCIDNLVWDVTFEYRRKRKMRLVNGFSVPAPETVSPATNEKMYIVQPGTEERAYECRWCNEMYYRKMFARGLVFLNKEDAIANAKAMCFIDPAN